MDVREPSQNAILPPGAKRLANGHLAVCQSAVWLLAGPLILNSAIQSILNITDTWFIGRLSTHATAAMGAVYWLILCGILLLGGVAMGVQTFAATAFGGRRYARASQAVWSGLVASLLTIPAFIALGFVARPILEHAGIDPDVRELALLYWWPRFVIGGPIALLSWALSSFFNGISQTRITLVMTAVMAISNAMLNQWFMFSLDMGIAGSAWGTVARQFTLGLHMGLSIAADLFGFALFQLMLVRVGSVAGAATQIVSMLTS